MIRRNLAVQQVRAGERWHHDAKRYPGGFGTRFQQNAKRSRLSGHSEPLGVSPPVKQRSITFRRELIPGASLESNSGRMSHPAVSGLRCKKADGMTDETPWERSRFPPDWAPLILLFQFH